MVPFAVPTNEAQPYVLLIGVHLVLLKLRSAALTVCIVDDIALPSVE